MKIFGKMKLAFLNWNRKRTWTYKAQVERARQYAEEDSRWMAHNPLVEAFCKRYLDLLDDRWETKSVEHAGVFRTKLGLTPKYESIAGSDACSTQTVILQENGIIRNSDGIIIGRLVKDTNELALNHKRRGVDLAAETIKLLLGNFRQKYSHYLSQCREEKVFQRQVGELLELIDKNVEELKAN